MWRPVARAVAYVEDADARVLALAERPSGEGWTLELQRDPAGAEPHCVVVDGGAVAYGAIAAADVAEETLRLRLTPEGADELGLDPEAEITLPGPDEARLVERSLARLLAG